MTVKELITELEKEPDDYNVLVSSDAEGNDISNIDEVAVSEKDQEIIIFPV